jgi:UDP-2,3-diacylglucosamine pyrophosphatase LpxH
MPDPNRLLTTLRRAARLFRATPGRIGFFTELPQGAEIVVVGDLHGQVENFRRVLLLADLARQPRRHLIVQEIIHGPFEYPDDGGDKSHQLLDLVAALKCQFPERVHYLLGNHELAQWRKQRIGKGHVDQNAWFVQGVVTAYGSAANDILAAYEDIFAAADLALRSSNRIFFSHTLPPAKAMADFNLATLQTDPIAAAEYASGGAVHGLLWGRDVTEDNVQAYLKKVDADWLISGHIPSEQGYRVPNSRQIILDALASPACCMLIPTEAPTTQDELLSCIRTL